MSIVIFFSVMFILSILFFGILQLYPEVLAQVGILNYVDSDFVSLVFLIISILTFSGLFISILILTLIGIKKQGKNLSRKDREELELEKIREELRALKGEI